MFKPDVKGSAKGRTFTAHITVSESTKGSCRLCQGPTRRSKYGILHRACSRCRYLMMIYGPNIAVMPWR